MYSKNDIVNLTIEDIGQDGEGIGHAEGGYTLFVKDALIGDVIQAKIMKAKKGYAFAKLIHIITPSPDRVTPRCSIADKCGGCQIQALRYNKQLEYKQNKVRNDLIRIGGFPAEQIDMLMHPIIGMDDPWQYRNKAQLPVGTDKEGRPVAGFYAGRTHTIIPVSHCWIQDPVSEKIITRILAWMERYHIPVYDEQTGKGLVRHILIREGIYTAQVMVCLVINASDASSLPVFTNNVSLLSDPADEISAMPVSANSVSAMPVSGMGSSMVGKPPAREKHRKQSPVQWQELISQLQAIPGMTSISVNLNPEKTNVILGKTTRTLWGENSIKDSLPVFYVTWNTDYVQDVHLNETNPQEAVAGKTTGGGTSEMSVGVNNRVSFVPSDLPPVWFHISPQSFYQVNPRQTGKLYSLVLYAAQLTGHETVWDLYCGVGTISLFLARFARKVYGVEVVPEAIQDARRNAELNGIHNVHFQTGKVEEVLPAYLNTPEAKTSPVDVVVVDPPRKGCDEKCLQTILQVKPSRVIYVSCDPATLARDLRILTRGGYQVQLIQPVDQFPHTVHVEVVALMSRKS